MAEKFMLDRTLYKRVKGMNRIEMSEFIHDMYMKGVENSVIEGGADQILLPKDWSEEMVIGYRRVTSRQLLNKPYFSMRIKPDVDILKGENIYKPVCPACGCDDVDKLSDNDKFTIVGAKGGVYEMKYNCKNTECRYYW